MSGHQHTHELRLPGIWDLFWCYMRWDGEAVGLGGSEGWGHVEGIRKVMLVVGIVCGHGRAGKLGSQLWRAYRSHW
jgi:hypothetical protein